MNDFKFIDYRVPKWTSFEWMTQKRFWKVIYLDNFLFFHYQSINFTSESFLMVFQMREFEYGLLWLKYLFNLICVDFFICQSFYDFIFTTITIYCFMRIIDCIFFFKYPIALCQSKCIPIAVDQSENHLKEWPKRSNCETILKNDWIILFFFFHYQSTNQCYQRVVFSGLPDLWIWRWIFEDFKWRVNFQIWWNKK